MCKIMNMITKVLIKTNDVKQDNHESLVNHDTTVVATNCDIFPFTIFCFPLMCILFPCDNTFLSLHWIEDA